ncbi:MAG: hypothetical protein ABEI97_04215, partial [Candidatus Nanohaloarchaea archaeon]
DFVEESRLDYVVPGLYAGGGLLLFLSPLYSQALAGYVMGFVNRATQSAGGVIAGTVAENQAAQPGQIIGQLGAFQAQKVLPAGTGVVAELFSGWTFALIGTATLITAVGAMVSRRHDLIGDVPPRVGYSAFIAVFTAVVAGLLFLLPGSAFTAFMFATAVAVLGVGMLALAPPDEQPTLVHGWYAI